MLRITARSTRAIALAAALLAGSLAPPASASVSTAESVRSDMAVITIVSYYSSSLKTNQVGQGEYDCEGVYTQIWGVQTNHIRTKTVECPT